jgi:hypothetical protein
MAKKDGLNSGDRGALRDLISDSFGPNSSKSFDNFAPLKFDPANDTSFDNSLNQEVCPKEHAKDFYRRAWLLISNAKTPNQIRTAFARANDQFDPTITNVITRIQNEIGSEPIQQLVAGLMKQGLDDAKALNNPRSAADLEKGRKAQTFFSDLLNPSALREIFQLDDEVRATLLRAAHIVFEELAASPIYQKALSDLRNTPAPRVLIDNDKDLPALSVATKILAATYAALWILIERPAHTAAQAGDPTRFVQIVGLTGVVLPNLTTHLTYCAIAELANDTELKPHMPRLSKILDNVKFSKHPQAHGALSAAGDGSAALFLYALFKFLKPLKDSFNLFADTAPLSHFVKCLENIPETELLAFTDTDNGLNHYVHPIRIGWFNQENPSQLINCKIHPNNGDVSVTIDDRSGGKESINKLFISHAGELTYDSSRYLIDLSDVEIQIFFKNNPDLLGIKEAISRAAMHARYNLRAAEKLMPSLMCRVQELPPDLFIATDDGDICLIVPSRDLESFLKLFEHLPEKYEQMAKATGYAPGKDPESYSRRLHSFTIYEKDD